MLEKSLIVNWITTNRLQTLLICHLDDDNHPAEDFDAACKGIQECLLTLEAMGKFITTMCIA